MTDFFTYLQIQGTRDPSAKGKTFKCLPPLLLALLSLCLSGQVAAAELPGGVRLGGHLKSLNVHVQAAPGGSFPDTDFSSNRLRLDLTGSAGETLDWELSAENLLLYTDPKGSIPLPGQSANRAVELEQSWNEGEDFANRLEVDRLNLRTTLLGVDWTVGRQAIGFGGILMFSPLDIIAPFPPDALDTDVRPGVDALRGVRYFGRGGQIGAVAVLGDGRDNHSYLATFSHNWKEVDVQGLGGLLRKRPTVGLGLAGSLGGLGIKAEATAYQGKNTDKAGGDLHDTFTIAALETWYRFESDIVLLAEYLYNGAGAEEPGDYPRAAVSAPFREGLSFLLGRHYLLLAPSYEAHPLATLSGLLIWNLDDGSFMLRPLVDLSLSDNLVLQAFWNYNGGRDPRPLPSPLPPLPRSEFGSAGSSGGLLIKYFF
ncbi:MAG: hypothetical protein C0617_00830 [Desulfuromonas sp.]|uniref:hypothetical protein n=1 Tax=Desulfuromonas sp. TaxID=892 RepID=UPI000CC75A21|nr:hypothetical protein [Desulfuromonas sp.]PLX86490.1 MAG: hypothetical protein C0617_00830 [Desulfuromonas sp.]